MNFDNDKLSVKPSHSVPNLAPVAAAGQKNCDKLALGALEGIGHPKDNRSFPGIFSPRPNGDIDELALARFRGPTSQSKRVNAARAVEEVGKGSLEDEFNFMKSPRPPGKAEGSLPQMNQKQLGNVHGRRGDTFESRSLEKKKDEIRDVEGFSGEKAGTGSELNLPPILNFKEQHPSRDSLTGLGDSSSEKGSSIPSEEVSPSPSCEPPQRRVQNLAPLGASPASLNGAPLSASPSNVSGVPSSVLVNPSKRRGRSQNLNSPPLGLNITNQLSGLSLGSSPSNASGSTSPVPDNALFEKFPGQRPSTPGVEQVQARLLNQNKERNIVLRAAMESSANASPLPPSANASPLPPIVSAIRPADSTSSFGNTTDPDVSRKATPFPAESVNRESPPFLIDGISFDEDDDMIDPKEGCLPPSPPTAREIKKAELGRSMDETEARIAKITKEVKGLK